MRSSRLNRTLALVLAALPWCAAAAGGPVDPPSPAQVQEARALVDAMKKNPRGPYTRLRWYCKDGTVHPPMPYPCGERGGGRQHGEYSPERKRLAELGIHAGTVVAAMDWDELWDEGRRQSRLRELPMERYLVEVDDGWVLRQARTYRGRVQVEDEEAKGLELLTQLLSRRDWVAQNFLLARESARALPHHGQGGDRTREVRRISKVMAERDRSFEELRVKIHNEPGRDDIAAVKAWLAAGKGTAAVRADADKLIAEMEALYGESARAERLSAAASRLREDGWSDLASLLDGALALPPRARVERIARFLRGVREAIETSATGAQAVTLLDLSVDAETEAVKAAFDVVRDPEMSRAELLAFAAALADGAYGTGLLSARERDEVSRPALALGQGGDAATPDYLAAARGLERASGWAIGTVRHAFAEPLALYSAVEPKAARFPDDLLRSSLMLPLADVASRLARDAESQSGLVHRVLGREMAGMAGLNPGASVGTLRIIRGGELASLRPDEIVVMPETSSELTPVAGILTVSEGNALSHVQMLARNLGIPNAAIPPLAVDSLEAHAGRQVLFAVGAGGSVVLAGLDEVEEGLRADILGAKADAANAPKVDAPVPDLEIAAPLRLADLHAGLSGKVVGPKAANVGELALKFPGRVAPALAIPFGIYADHAAGPGSPKERLDRAFEQHRAGDIDDGQLAAEVEVMRKAVEAMTLRPETRARLARMMEEEFGPDGSYGVFVRSDTNVEDLPQFTGAGLNKTIAHVVGTEQILAAIPKVWASPFTTRAMSWRSQALTRPEEVYPSVLLMKSVPSEKSGVLATTDVVSGGPGITVAMAWGVGGGVDGEVTESLILRGDGGLQLVSESKAPYQRTLLDQGGVSWKPAPAGRVLEDAEIAQIRPFVRELEDRLAPAPGDDGRPLPWDVELGFVSGKLVLFQVRPLVEKGAALANEVVRRLAPSTGGGASTVSLDRAPGRGITLGGLLPAGRETKYLYCTLAEHRP